MKYEELRFSDDFLFCKIMQNNPEHCKRLIEVILGIKIREILSINQQEPIQITPDGRGVRLDVYVEGDADRVYDIEMQTSNPQNLPKRSRYYQGMIDLGLIEKGADYQELKKSYIIFINLFDPFGKGMCKYTFKNMCLEDPTLELGDEAVKVFLNTEGGDKGELSPELRELLEFIGTGLPEGDFTAALQQEVVVARRNTEWKEAYMTLEMKYREKFAEGRAEGRAEGKDFTTSLFAKLFALGRDEDVKRATLDPAFLEKLEKEFPLK